MNPLKPFSFDLQCDAPELVPDRWYCFYGQPQKTVRILKVERGPYVSVLCIDGTDHELPDETKVIVPVGHVFACMIKVRIPCAGMVLQAHGLAID